MDVPLIYQFLKEIAANNNREWFHTHRDFYEAARTEFEKLLVCLISRISLFDDTIRGVEPKDCTYRFYRDIRFTEDKRPYKGHFGGYISTRGKKSQHCGYYIHLEPGESLLAGGCYCPSAPLLRLLRQAIYDNIEEFREIVENPAFSHFFPIVGEQFLKRAPKGFPKDFPYMHYLQCKDYTVCCYRQDSFFCRDDFMDEIVAAFRQVKPYGDFLNYTIDEFEQL